MANADKMRKTRAMTKDEKIKIVQGSMITTLSGNEYARSVDVSVEAISRWREAVEAGDNWSLLSRAECDETIKIVASKAPNFKMALMGLRKKGCRYSSAHAKKRMTEMGFVFAKSPHGTKAEYEAKQKHIVRILKSGNWRSFQAIAEIVGSTATTVSRIAEFNGIEAKIASGRKKKGIEYPDTREVVQLRKPEKIDPLLAMVLGMRV